MPFIGNSTTSFNTVFQDVCMNMDDFRNLVITKLYKKLGVDEIVTLVSPVTNGSNIPSISFGANYNSIPYTDGDDCAISTCDFSPEYLNKQWIVKEAECRYEECMKGMDEKFLQLFNKHKRIDPESSEYDFAVEYISDMLADILANSLLAKVWLSDTDLTESTINGLDGVIAQVKADQNNAIDIDQNATLTGEQWYEVIEEALAAYEDADFGEQADNPVIYMDSSDARKLVRWLNTQDRTKINCDCIDADGVVRADRFTLEGLYIHGGYRVIAIPYKKMLAAFPDDYVTPGEDDNPDTLVDPNLLLITPMENVLVGNENNDDLNELKYFYNPEDRLHKWDLGMRFGVAVPTPYFIHGFKND